VDVVRDQRDLNRGFSDTLNRGFEFVLTMAVFGGAGWLLDRLAGTAPVLLAVFMVLAVVGQTARLWYAYDIEMRRHEAELPSARSGSRPAQPPVPSVTRATIALVGAMVGRLRHKEPV